MKQTNKRHILARYSLIIAGMLLFSSFIVWDLFKTTVVYAPKWNEKAGRSLDTETTIEPERGRLLADDGTVLAANLQFYTIRIDWQAPGIKDSVVNATLPALCDSLSAFVGGAKSAQEWKQQMLAAKRKKNRSYRVLKDLSYSDFLRVTSFPFLNLKPGKNGLVREVNMKRSKPYGKMASRSIGNVGELPSRHGLHGVSGLEMALDSMLYGIPGKARKIQLTNKIINGESVPAVKGYDVTTTINVPLQDIVEEELYTMLGETNARWGTCVLMEVATGEIKAISNLEWNDAAGDYIEGRNNAVLGYEPGSVMKPISMMVALEDGIVTDINRKWETGHTWIYAGRAITDPHGGAALSARQIIETSSNIGMSKIIVSKYGSHPDGFRQRLEQMGFFEPFNSGIGGERLPMIPKLGNTETDRLALTRIAFGYSTLIPPLRTLAMYNAIANDGKYVCPHLVKKFSREGQPDSIVPVRYIRQHVCSPENAAKLRIMMHDVVWGEHGTARKWVQDSCVEIAGKTGTAYIITPDGRYGSLRRLTFCGFFPYNKPRYSCIVMMLGANRGAGASSGVVLKNIARKMYAKGLLSTAPNVFASSGDHKPTFLADDAASAGMVKKALDLNSYKVIATPKHFDEGMPSLRGLSARDAVLKLAKLGLNARLHGMGFVKGQSLPPGSNYKRGQIVELQLAN